MPSASEFSKTGSFLFKWRSYFPLCLIPLILLAMPYFHYPLNNHNLDMLWEVLCLAISLSGLLIRIITIGFTPKGTSGTNTKKQVAGELNTTGMYSVTRNPLYLGNFVIWFGVFMFFRLWWVNLTVMLSFWLYYERIIFAEEEFLEKQFGDEYLKWAKKTPVFIPNFSKWKSPDRDFSFKRMLKNEYKSFYAIIISLLVLEIIGDAFVEHELELDTMWTAIFSLSSVFYIVMRLLKKKTKILDS